MLADTEHPVPLSDLVCCPSSAKEVGPNLQGPFYSDTAGVDGRHCATNTAKKISVCAKLDWYYVDPETDDAWKLSIGLHNYGVLRFESTELASYLRKSLVTEPLSLSCLLLQLFYRRL